MPTVKNLLDQINNPVSPINTAPPPSRDAAPPVAPSTAAVATQAATPAPLAVPSFVTQLPALPEPDAKGSAPYIGCCDPKSGNKLELQAAGIADGQFFVKIDGGYKVTHPLRFWLVTAAEFATVMNQAGQITFASRDMGKVEFKPGTPDEHYAAVCVVDLGDKLLPVAANFRGTKAGAVVNMIRALKVASTPEWGNLSDAHKLSMGFPYPFGRLVGTATTRKRTSKSSGNPYYVGDVVVQPAGITDMKRLHDALQDQGFIAALHAAGDAYAARVEELSKLANAVDGVKVGASAAA